MITNIRQNPILKHNCNPCNKTSPDKEETCATYNIVKELSNFHYPIINRKNNISFGSLLAKSIAKTEILKDGKPILVDVIGKKINQNQIYLSLTDNGKCLGFADLHANLETIEILLLDTTCGLPNIKYAGTTLIQIITEMAIKLKKGIIVNASRMGSTTDNPIMFYYSKGFVATDKNIDKQIMKEINKAKAENRRPDSNIFDKYGKISLTMPEKNIKKWQEIISKSPIL